MTIARSLGLTLGQFDRLPADERDYWQALHAQESVECKNCGRSRSECSDHERPFYPFRTVCYATMEREAAGAMYGELHKEEPYHDGSFASWAKERSSSHPYHFGEGVSIGVADVDLSPDDKFTTEVDARPA